MTWEEIVSEHGERLFRAAYRVLHDASDAEDVTQDVMLEAFRISQRQGSIPDAPLLRRMATLRAIDRLRRRHQAEPLDEQDLSATSPLPVQQAEVDEQMRRLQNALAGLSDQECRCFVLRYFEGLTNKQIAEDLDVDPGAVSTALYKARNKLRDALGSESPLIGGTRNV